MRHIVIPPFHDSHHFINYLINFITNFHYYYFIIDSLQIVRNGVQCVNEHRFCRSCIHHWTKTSQSHNRCPVCRTYGQFNFNKLGNQTIMTSTVKCLRHSDCVWRGKLKDYSAHICDIRTGKRSMILISTVYLRNVFICA